MPAERFEPMTTIILSACDFPANVPTRWAATVADLLRDAHDEVFAVAARGGRSSKVLAAIARPSVVAAAVQFATDRTARRVARVLRDEASGASAQPGRILREAAARAAVKAAKAAARKAKRAAAAQAHKRQRLIRGEISHAAVERLVDDQTHFETVSAEADGLVKAIVRTVGTIGEQAARDLSEMQTDEDFGGKRGRHHKLTRTTLHRVEHLRDWSAVLVTLRDYCSFGSSRWGGPEASYGSRGGSSYRCYLIVRDTTTAEAHILRVPPKFGNAETQHFSKLRSAAERIRAAVAWTFDRESTEYRPTVEA
jgi:hypothetical protein